MLVCVTFFSVFKKIIPSSSSLGITTSHFFFLTVSFPPLPSFRFSPRPSSLFLVPYLTIFFLSSFHCYVAFFRFPFFFRLPIGSSHFLLNFPFVSSPISCNLQHSFYISLPCISAVEILFIKKVFFVARRWHVYPKTEGKSTSEAFQCYSRAQGNIK